MGGWISWGMRRMKWVPPTVDVRTGQPLDLGNTNVLAFKTPTVGAEDRAWQIACTDQYGILHVLRDAHAFFMVPEVDDGRVDRPVELEVLYRDDPEECLVVVGGVPGSGSELISVQRK